MFPDHYDLIARLVLESVSELPLQVGAEGYGPLYDLEIVNVRYHIDFNKGMTGFRVKGKRDLMETPDGQI